MKLARIGTAGPNWLVDDLSGTGAAMYPGRWNLAGEHVVYAAPTLAMAVLETVAHVNADGLPLNRYVVTIDVPTEVWKARRVIKASALPGGWDAMPHGMASTMVGSNWYNGQGELLLEVPSAIVPEETVVVINSQHPDIKLLTANTERRFQYNMVLRP